MFTDDDVLALLVTPKQRYYLKARLAKDQKDETFQNFLLKMRDAGKIRFNVLNGKWQRAETRDEITHRTILAALKGKPKTFTELRRTLAPDYHGSQILEQMLLSMREKKLVIFDINAGTWSRVPKEKVAA